jgi:predicted YcjX-like family ATPase
MASFRPFSGLSILRMPARPVPNALRCGSGVPICYPAFLPRPFPWNSRGAAVHTPEQPPAEPLVSIDKPVDDNLLDQVGRWITRSADETVRGIGQAVLRRRLRVAVTGLSHAGKTVFMTALLHNLRLAARLGEGQVGHLPFFEPVAKGALDDVTLAPLGDLPPFPFEANWRRIVAPSAGAAPDFPPSTTGVSGFGAALRYRPQGFWGRYLAHTTTVTIEMVDYPGEWLLDLPLLEMSYADWSASALRLAESGSRAGIGGDWRSLHADAPATEALLESARLSFTGYLAACRAAPYHLSHVQPGRFLNPGDSTADLSAFRFCPLRRAPGTIAEAGSLGEAMAQRFERYKAEIVHPFFRDVFSRFDRQLVLVDVIGALNAGPESFRDMRRALREVLPSFNRGSGSLLARLFQPRTEKVLFAATKADHVTANQFHNLRLLLRAMMADDLGNLPISAEETDFAALSAIKCTANRRVMYQGQQITVLEGIIRGRDLPEQLYPGEIPEHLPSEDDWRSERFRFYDFRPPDLEGESPMASGRGIPHVHLDRALQFLTGDLFW